jgi:hypothetical protein
MAKSKYSKEDWAIALKDGLFKRINSIRKDLVGQLIQGIENPITVDGKTGEAFTPQDLIWRSNHSDESIDLALKILNSRNKKIQYYKRKINEAFSKGHKVYHLTLPFYENEENKLSLLEKHMALKSLIENLGKDLLITGTIGVGEENGGIHYHLIVSGQINKRLWIYSSFVGLREVFNNPSDISAISIYLANNFIYAKTNPHIGVRTIYRRKYPLKERHTNNQELSEINQKPIVLYNMNNAITSINKSKQYPIYMDNVL